MESSTCIMQETNRGDPSDANQVSCSNGQLSDSHTGVVRLSETSGSSGQGPIATFAHDLAHSGCADWNGAAPSEPYDQLEFVLDTGDDDLRSDSGLVAYVLDSSNKVVDTVILHQSGETLFDNDTEWDEIKVPVTAVRYTDIASIKLEFVQVLRTSGTCSPSKFTGVTQPLGGSLSASSTAWGTLKRCSRAEMATLR